MRVVVTFSFLIALVISGSATSGTRSTAQTAAPVPGHKPKDVYMLGAEAKLGVVSFSHVNHITKIATLKALRRWLVSSVTIRPNPLWR